jgi:hypothetical protein
MGRVSWRPASALPYVDCALTTYPSKLTPFETPKDRRMLSATLTSLSTGVEKSGSKYMLCGNSVLSKYHSLDRRVLPHSQLVRCAIVRVHSAVGRGTISNGHGTDTKTDLPRQSVSAFCFLRFIVPAILHPHLFGLCSGTFLMRWKDIGLRTTFQVSPICPSNEALR